MSMGKKILQKHSTPLKARSTMPNTYKVGDVLLCHEHIGVAKLHGHDYQQLPSKSQV